MKTHYIVLAGSIGVGKTTTARALGEALPKSNVFLETRDVFLAHFYSDPERFAFLNQLAYSLQYLDQAIDISKTTGHVIQDRSIYDTHEVFSRWRHTTGLISSDEFVMLERTVRAADKLVRPTMLVLLETPPKTALQRIKARQISTELHLQEQFLQDLTIRYREWFHKFDMCSKLSVSTAQSDVSEVVRKVLDALRTHS